MLLSIDLGMINSTATLMVINTRKIVRWTPIKILDKAKNPSFEIASKNLMNSLNELELTKKLENSENDIHDVIIVIELQPGRNAKTIFLSGQMFMYFTILKSSESDDPEYSNYYYRISKIITYHAKNKLNVYRPLPGDPEIKITRKDAYAANKQQSIQHAKILLKRYDPDWIPFFDSFKKKDDLSDSYLMGLAYIEFVIRTPPLSS